MTMNYSGMLTKMFIFAVLLIIGYFGARKGVLGEGFAKSTSWLLLNVYIVCAIINSVTGDRPDIPDSQLWSALLILTVLMLMIYGFSYIAALLLGKDGLFPQRFLLMAVVNSLFVGIPIVQALCGSEAVFYVGISCIPYNILLYTVGTGMLQHGKGTEKFRLRSVFSPALIASLAALLIFVLNIKVPALIKEFFSTTSAATVPVSMIVIGATMGTGSFTDAFKDRKVLLLSAVRLVLTPLVIFFILRPFIHSEILLATCVVLAACPSAVLCTPLSIRYGYDYESSSRTIMVTTVFSMVTIPVLLYILF